MTFPWTVWAKVVAGLSLVLLTVFALLSGLWSLERMDERIASRVERERNAYWTAQIEKSNAEIERARAEQAGRALADQAKAQAEIDGLRSQLAEIERVNASLPGADACGLDVERVRRLPR